MKPDPMMALVLFAGASAVWLAATIDPLMFSGAACGPTLAEHCWRCGALAADLTILAATAIRQIVQKPARI
jgi:hypothetical protein